MSSGSGGGHLAQFIIGRVIVYISVGLVEVCVTYGVSIFEIPGQNADHLFAARINPKSFHLNFEASSWSPSSSFLTWAHSLPLL